MKLGFLVGLTVAGLLAVGLGGWAIDQSLHPDEATATDRVVHTQIAGSGPVSTAVQQGLKGNALPQCLRQSRQQLAEAAVNADSALRGPRVVFLGDSYTAARQATRVRNGYAVDLARAEGWKPILLGVGGTGFANPGRCGHDVYAYRYGNVVAEKPDAVIIEGGYNDRGTNPRTEQRLVLRGLRTLHRAMPGVPIALVGPTIPSAAVTGQILPIAHAFGRAAARTGTPFVDPADGHWFTRANRGRLISVDHIHPDDAGYAYMARRIKAALGGWPAH